MIIKKSYTRIITLIIFICLTAFVQGQKYDEGVIVMDLTKIETIDGSPLDTSMFKMVKSNIGRQLNIIYYISKDRFVILKKDILGRPQRVVYDFSSNTMYEFIDLNGQPAFKKIDIKKMMEQVQGVTDNLNFEIDSFPEYNEIRFGLECKKYNITTPEGINMELLATNDIRMPALNQINIMPIDLGTIVLSTVDNTSSNLRLTFGATSFNPIIVDRSILSIDTIGLMNANSINEQFEHMFDGVDEYESLVAKEFGEYKSLKLNHNLIKTLAKEGILDSNYYVIENVLNGGSEKNFDIPEIMLLGRRNNARLKNMERKELLQVLNKHNLLSPTVEKLLKLGVEEWQLIDEDKQYLSICLAAIKDHINKKEIKENIVNNLEVMGYCDFTDKEIKDKYIQGSASLIDIINEVYLFTPLQYKVVNTNNEIYEVVKEFIKQALSEYGVHFSFTEFDNSININDGKREYEVDINKFKESEYDYESETEIVKDTAKINQYFYNQLTDVVRQISADNNLNKIFNIYHFEPPFTYDINSYDYHDIIESCQILDFGIDQLYLWKATPQSEDIWGVNIPISFPFHPDVLAVKLNLGNFSIGDGTGQFNYITTEEKEKFVKYLKKYQSEYNISDETLQYKIDNIKNRLFNDSDDLAQILPNVRITVNKTFDIQPKSLYSPTFSEGRNEFKHAYYSLHQVIGDDFDATNYRYDSEAHKIYFQYKGQEHIINPGEKNMLRFIIDNLKPSKSGRQFYAIQQFSLTKEEYYYLTPAQKSDLGKLVKLNF